MSERTQLETGSRPEQAIYPDCARAGRVSEKSGNRLCLMHGDRKFVNLDVCNACPLAGLVNGDADAAEKLIPPRRKAKLKKSSAAQTEPALSCSHRGAVVRSELCKLCGGIEKNVEIFACDLHGECSLHRFKAGKGPRSCVSCKDRTP